MASAMYPDDIKAPPPYATQDATNFGTSYQQQVPPPSVHSTHFIQPPPIPVYTQVPVIGASFLSHYPATIQCPRCHQQVVTVVQHEAGGGTWLISLIICLFGGVFGCCLIPFCVPSCQDTVHTCPSCRQLIGRRNVF